MWFNRQRCGLIVTVFSSNELILDTKMIDGPDSGVRKDVMGLIITLG